LGTNEKSALLTESIVSLAGAFCGGLALGVLALIFAAYLPAILIFGTIFAAVSGCIEFVKLSIRRRTAGESAALAAADAIGIFAGFGLAQLLSMLAP